MRAVEVTAMLGDSVIGVKHCADPRAGKVSRATWTLFAIGAVSLALLVFAFASGLRTAVHNQEQYAYETVHLHKPDYAIRLGRLPDAFDWIAVGGVIAALLTLTSALARLHREKVAPWVRIGTAPDVDFAIERVSTDSFPLVEPRGDDFAFNIDAGMEGEVAIGGQTTRLADLIAQGRTRISPIPADARIRVRAGAATLLVSSIERPRPDATTRFAFDRPFLYSLAGTTVVAATTVALLFHTVAADSSANIDLASLEDTSTRTATKTAEDPVPAADTSGSDSETGGDVSLAVSARLAGNPASSRVEGRLAMKQTLANPQLARQQAIEAAATAGILGSAALVQGGAFASLTGVGDISSGFDDADVYGGLFGKETGEANGNFGIGRSAFGVDFGGSGWGPIGSGRYGTIGSTGTCYSCLGNGRGGGSGTSGRIPKVPEVPLCAVTGPSISPCLRINGDLDKAIIRRYIKRNIQKIAYCYEKQLLSKPNLAGTVTAQFFVSPTGTVISSQGSGVDPDVANCVAEVVGSIEFPKPLNGSGVQVNYPFTFRPTGA